MSDTSSELPKLVITTPTLPRARAIFPRPETDALLAAWLAYDARLKSEPNVSAMTQRRRDLAADALYDLMFLASTALTKADVPPQQHAA